MTRTFVCLLIFLMFEIGNAQSDGDQILDPASMHKIELFSSNSNLIDTLDVYWNRDLFNPGNRTYFPVKAYIDGQELDTIGIRKKGGSTGFDPKSPLKLDFNRFVDSFSFDELTKINLHQGSQDLSYTREHLAYAILRAFGIPAPRTAPAEVYLNDEYLGLYTLVEQIDPIFINQKFSSKYGTLLKEYQGNLVLKSDSGSIQKSEDFMEEFMDIPIDSLDEKANHLINIEHLLKFHIVARFINLKDNILDTYNNFYQTWDYRTNRFSYVPWDVNLALFDGRKYEMMRVGAEPVFSRLIQNSTIRREYQELYCFFLVEFMDLDKWNNWIDDYVNLINEAVERDPVNNKIQEISGIKDLLRSQFDRYLQELADENVTCAAIDSITRNLVINEVVASNKDGSGISPPYGGFPDWIEIYNKGSDSVHVNDFFLSNDEDFLYLWRIDTSIVLAPNEYFIVWANRKPHLSSNSSNFKINKNKSELYLTHESGRIFDHVIILDQDENISYARVPNGTGTFIKHQSTFKKSNDISTSIETDGHEDNIFIFPNPNNLGFLKLKRIEQGPVPYKIYSIGGKLIHQGMSDGENISCGELEAGMYHLQILNKDVWVKGKFIVL